MRLATLSDVSKIVELGSRSLKDGPYGKLIEDRPEVTRQLTEAIISEKGRVLLWEEGSEVVGLLAFIVFPHYFTGELTAGELMWYVEPEFRAGGSAMRLFWAAEEMARELGAKKLQFTAPNEAVGAIYKRFGFQQIEVMFQKAL